MESAKQYMSSDFTSRTLEIVTKQPIQKMRLCLEDKVERWLDILTLAKQQLPGQHIFQLLQIKHELKPL